jgi:hypothetical protein
MPSIDASTHAWVPEDLFRRSISFSDNEGEAPQAVTPLAQKPVFAETIHDGSAPCLLQYATDELMAPMVPRSTTSAPEPESLMVGPSSNAGILPMGNADEGILPVDNIDEFSLFIYQMINDPSE